MSKIVVFDVVVTAHFGHCVVLNYRQLFCPFIFRQLDGAEAMYVYKELTGNWPLQDEDGGFSLLDAAEQQLLLQCVACWQHRYCAYQVHSTVLASLLGELFEGISLVWQNHRHCVLRAELFCILG